MHLTVEELLDYTGEERARWEQWFRDNTEDLLKVPIQSDRETTIGALVLHIFGSELRFAQRLNGETLTDYRHRPCHHLDESFGFGIESRKALRRFVQRATPEDWERTIDFEMRGRLHRASVRKIVFHVLLHEIRHWAQIAKLLRERGFVPAGNHDLLNSSALS
jgi:uncharacterized damage-inducible protein DinB